jgi:hypothetical protein
MERRYAFGMSADRSQPDSGLYRLVVRLPVNTGLLRALEVGVP